MNTVWVVKIGDEIKIYESELSARRYYDKEARWYKNCKIFEYYIIK